MHRNGGEVWCEIHRGLVVVQQSGFQELTILRTEQQVSAGPAC
jgi:hypothetical protein